MNLSKLCRMYLPLVVLYNFGSMLIRDDYYGKIFCPFKSVLRY